MRKLIKQYVDFHKKAEKLKTTTRHSWLTDPSRQESVAEHSWMLCLLALLLHDQLETKTDLLKVLKMVAIHDLPEAVTGDIPSHEVSARQNNKHKLEGKALRGFVADFPKREADEIFSLWKEFEEAKTPEAQFANSLDKIEALLQHNIADIGTWGRATLMSVPTTKTIILTSMLLCGRSRMRLIFKL